MNTAVQEKGSRLRVPMRPSARPHRVWKEGAYQVGSYTMSKQFFWKSSVQEFTQNTYIWIFYTCA